MKAYEMISGKTVFQGKILDVRQDIISLPDGKEALREVVVRGGAAAVVPVDQEGRIVFVRQYRHPTGTMVLEIPAGCCDDEEEPMVCAARELEEETGLKAGRLTHLTSIYPSAGYSTEIIHLYLAEDLTPGTQKLDEDEFVSIERYTPEEAVKMIMDGSLVDSKSIVGILCCKDRIMKQ